MTSDGFSYAILGSEDPEKVVASNVSDRIRSLQAVLQRAPPDKGHHLVLDAKEINDDEEPFLDTKDGMSAEERKLLNYVQENALVKGHLYMQKTTGKWKKLWCSYFDGVLTYRADQYKHGKIGGQIRVTYCEADMPPDDKKTAPATPVREGKESVAASPSAAGGGGPASPGSPAPPASPSTVLTPANHTRYDELYWSYLESQEAQHSFKLFSPSRIYMFRTEGPELCAEFVSAVRGDLQSGVPAEVWSEQVAAARELAPLLREQFMLQVHRYTGLLKSLAKSGFMEDELPITSTRKEKSGVLCMETPNEFTKWRDYYFVLFEGCLFYYKDSKSTTPTGFITLRYASVYIDTKRLARGEYVFHVKTPLRTVVCRCKHAVALSEWVACLEASLGSSQPGSSGSSGSALAGVTRLLGKTLGTSTPALGPGTAAAPSSSSSSSAAASAQGGPGPASPAKRSSMAVLEEITRLLADSSSFDTVLGNAKAAELFRKFLVTEGKCVNELDFFLAEQELQDPDISLTDLVTKCHVIHTTWFMEESKEALLDMPPSVLDAIETGISEPSAALFREASQIVSLRLANLFAAFKETEPYQSLNQQIAKSVSNSDKRDVPAFDPQSTFSFLLKVKGTKKSRDIPFSKKQHVFTIGRDKSNNLVIEDSRVSRSHARVEYSDTYCEYIDLGSSCGSKLNGRPVLRAKLQPGDVIELGQSTLIFQVKKKKRFSFFG